MIEFRPITGQEIVEVIDLWQACDLVLDWHDPIAEAKLAVDGPHSTILGAFASAHLIAAAMADWDGNQAWICRLGVEAAFRQWGIGRTLTRECEDWLVQFDVRGVCLKAHSKNAQVAKFCEAIGYDEDVGGVFCRQIRPLKR